MKGSLAKISALVAVAMVTGAGPALAYIGPGAGLSLLGALWGVVAAVLAALLFLCLWPLRRFMKRQRQSASPAQAKAAGQQREQTSPQRR